MPSYEGIAVLAHRFFENRGWEHGAHEQDWFQAEQEITFCIVGSFVQNEGILVYVDGEHDE